MRENAPPVVRRGCRRQGSQLRRLVDRPDAKAAIKLVGRESAGAVCSADELVDHLGAIGKGVKGKIMPVQWAEACCQPVLETFRNRGAHPPGSRGEAEQVARARETVHGENNRRGSSRRWF